MQIKIKHLIKIKHTTALLKHMQNNKNFNEPRHITNKIKF